MAPRAVSSLDKANNILSSGIIAGRGVNMGTGSLQQTNNMEVIGKRIEFVSKPVPKPIVSKPIVPKAIYWIRHAESCANLLENKIVDTYLDEEKANQHSELFARHAKEHRYFDDDGNVIKQSDDSYPENIGKILTSISQRIKDKTVFSIPKGIFKGAESRWLFHPPLSSVGIQQAKKLSTRNVFKGVVKECNVFITSATVRTIMTAIYSLNRIKNVTLYVVPYINEKMNEASEFGLDFVNTGIPKDKIDEIIQCVIKYVKSAAVSEQKDPVEQVEQVKYQFKFGTITIDTGFYHSVEPLPVTTTSNQEGVLIKNIETFKTSIIRDLCKYMNKKTPFRQMTVPDMIILAYSHGYVINNLLTSHGSDYQTLVPYAPNVSMFKEDYKAKTMVVVKVDKENAPDGGVFVRKNAKEINTADNDYDTLNNVSPCSLYGLRGEVNEILFGYQQQQQQQKYAGGSTRKYKKYRTRRNLSKYRKQTKRPRRTSRIRKNRRSLKK
jgi:hypothetical protein